MSDPMVPTAAAPQESSAEALRNALDAGIATANARSAAPVAEDPPCIECEVRHAQKLYDAGDHTVQQIADLLRVPRTTIYGHLDPSTVGNRLTTTGEPKVLSAGFRTVTAQTPTNG